LLLDAFCHAPLLAQIGVLAIMSIVTYGAVVLGVFLVFGPARIFLGVFLYLVGADIRAFAGWLFALT